MTTRDLSHAARRALPLGAVLVAAVLVAAMLTAAMPLVAQRQGVPGSPPAPASTSGPNVDWRSYGNDLASTRYSALSQIDASNFNKLEVAWRFKTDNLGPRTEGNLQSTPLVVNGTLYSTGGARRAVVALDATTGELKWVYGLNEGKRGENASRGLSGRGLAYWTNGKEERIVYVTPGYRLIALDARTGRPVPGFGQDGTVDLKADDDQQTMDLETGDIGLHTAPLIASNVIIVGAAHSTSSGQTPKSRTNVKGSVRGYDARTGRKLWTFHTIPSAGEVGFDTWLKDSTAYTGNLGAWAQMSADEELAHVYLGTEVPTSDAYGGQRPGANLFANTMLALDIRTGRRIWHFQAIHHDIWDYDFPCAPVLANVTVNGRPMKVVAQASKQGFLYVLDRTNGQPVWPIEERPVPKGDVAGEWYAPTQPFPTRPPAFDRQGISEADLIDFTPALNAEAKAIAARYRLGPLFTPAAASTWNGPLATLMLPHMNGATNWPGGSLDPETGTFYIFSKTDPFAIGLVTDARRSTLEFIQGIAPNPDPAGPKPPGLNAPVQVQGLPLVRPPWGRITAINLNSGDITWQVAHGDTPDNVKNHPALMGVTIPRTGRQGQIGTLVTRTLLIAGEGGFATQPDGRRGALLRAYDKATGKDAGAVYIPAPQSGGPMTYMVNGTQYIVIAVSGPGYTGEFIAFRLPKAA